jgi:hypothetical protein
LGDEIGFVLKSRDPLQHRHDAIEGTQGALLVGPKRCVGSAVAEGMQASGEAARCGLLASWTNHHLRGHRANSPTGIHHWLGTFGRSLSAAAGVAGAGAAGQLTLAQHLAQG